MPLAVGVYGLRVNVSDSWDNVLSGVFTLTVQSATTTPTGFLGTPIEILVLFILVPLFIILAALALLRRRRSRAQRPPRERVILEPEPVVEAPPPTKPEPPVESREAQRRRQLLEQVATRFKSISMRDLAELLEFRKLSDLRRWLLKLPSDYPLIVDGDTVVITSRSREKIQQLIEEIKSGEKEGK